MRNSSSPVPGTPVSAASSANGTPVANNTATGEVVPLESIAVGCKLFVQKMMGTETEFRRAEILSIKEIDGKCEYYVHYEEFNKRLDEWVPANRLNLTREIEHPKGRKGKPPGSAVQGKASPVKSTMTTTTTKNKRHAKAGGGNAIPETPSPLNRVSNLHDKRKVSDTRDDSEEPPNKIQRAGSVGSVPPGEGEDEGEAMEIGLEDEDGMGPPAVFSKEQEIEKLRTSGSMTQSISEVSRVKNLNRIQFGKHEVETWYFSPYPSEFAHSELVYICEFCLGFYVSSKQFSRHRQKCELKHPPGNEIYRNDNISFFEIDGRKQRTWCRSLCLLSKLFLDHKTVYYDVDPFLFYVMTQKDEYGWHMIGYFSKEKESSEGYNLACILTLPQYQRMGYGKLLIQFSYELSKIERKIGSPEKPLSDLGLLSYRAYWAEVIVDALIRFRGEITIEELSASTAITPTDVLHTLQTLDALKYYRSQHIICLTDKVVEQYNRTQKKKRKAIDSSKLEWKPPMFTQAQLRFL